ncbi:hypothetical protein VTH06DRAFT_8639 [Thermothelomyces fergusii]
MQADVAAKSETSVAQSKAARKDGAGRCRHVRAGGTVQRHLALSWTGLLSPNCADAGLKKQRRWLHRRVVLI